MRFRYNDLDSLKQCFDANPGQIACVVMEAATSEEVRRKSRRDTAEDSELG